MNVKKMVVLFWLCVGYGCATTPQPVYGDDDQINARILSFKEGKKEYDGISALLDLLTVRQKNHQPVYKQDIVNLMGTPDRSSINKLVYFYGMKPGDAEDEAAALILGFSIFTGKLNAVKIKLKTEIIY